MAPSFSNLWLRAKPYAATVWHGAARWTAAHGLIPRLRGRRQPDRLLVAPSDLRAGNAAMADDIYAGRFPLAGQIIDFHGVSPFEAEMLAPEHDRALHDFGWLRHIRAAGHELAAANARALVNDWLRLHGQTTAGVAWEADVAARRLIAWLSHAPVVLKGADRSFYRMFLKGLAVHRRFLARVAASAPDGVPRLKVRIALALATLALPSTQEAQRRALGRLDREIDRQILPDGGHVSRNPEALVDLLTDLLSLRQVLVNLGSNSPGRLIAAIDRMFPALVFFRHGGGELALFNGAGAVSGETIERLLRYSEGSGKPFRQLPHSGYQRLEAGGTRIIADTGPSPPASFSCEAHAGCLSFEMSSGRHRLIVNAGRPAYAPQSQARFARMTAAHSTLVVDNTSSARFSRSRLVGPLIVAGVRRVDVHGQRGSDAVKGFTARHDGYAGLFGLDHERSIELAANGMHVVGRDRLAVTDGESAEDCDDEAVVRFHVHPAVGLDPGMDGTVRLTAPDGVLWTFSCTDVVPQIEDDIFFADPSGPRAAQQITLTFRLSETAEIWWKISRA